MKNRNVVVVVLAAILLAMILPIEALSANKDFPDIHGHWAEKYILALAEKGGISGMPDGKFYPGETVTFPQFVKIIIGCEFGEIAPAEGGDWASGYIRKAVDVGIIDFADTENQEAITRYDAARIVAESLRYIYNEQEESDTSISQKFEDYPYSCKACRGSFEMTVGQCYVKGIITGRPGPVFDGDDSLTRAEACIIIMKMIDPTLRTPPPAE